MLTVPLPLLMMPEKLLVWLLSPMVMAAFPATLLVMEPAPVRPLMVMRLPLRSRVPVAETLPFPVPEGMAAVLAIFKVPPAMVVSPA